MLLPTPLIGLHSPALRVKIDLITYQGVSHRLDELWNNPSWMNIRKRLLCEREGPLVGGGDKHNDLGRGVRKLFQSHDINSLKQNDNHFDWMLLRQKVIAHKWIFFFF